MKFYHQLINVFGLNEHWKDTCFPLYNSIKEFTENNSIDLLFLTDSEGKWENLHYSFIKNVPRLFDCQMNFFKEVF